MLTGHGDFQEYLHRIDESPSEACQYCDTHDDDFVEHTVLRCTALRRARAILQADSVPELVQKISKVRRGMEIHHKGSRKSDEAEGEAQNTKGTSNATDRRTAAATDAARAARRRSHDRRR